MNNNIHDKTSKLGFDVSLEQLAHDLTLLQLKNDLSSTSLTDQHIIYDQYCVAYNKWKVYLEDKTRYDSNYTK